VAPSDLLQTPLALIGPVQTAVDDLRPDAHLHWRQSCPDEGHRLLRDEKTRRLRNAILR
jgi:hypothetical protein